MNRPLNIVIADDHPIFRRGLCDVIRQDPAFCLQGEATHGLEALELVSTLQPDIVVLDIHMPQMSGLDVARRLLTEHPNLHIVLLTMHEDRDLLDTALDLGIRAYVLKEDAIDDLLRAVRAAMEGRTFVSASLSGMLLQRREEAERLRQERPQLDALTPMERKVLRMIADDKTTKEIADELGKATRTVETHRQNISQKLNLHGSHSLLKFAFRNKAHL